MGRRTGDGIATNATGRKFRGGKWDNGQLVREVKLILEKHGPTKSQYPSACALRRGAQPAACLRRLS